MQVARLLLLGKSLDDKEYFMKKFLVVLFVCLFMVTQISFADYIEETELSQIAVKTVLEFDNMVILPTTKTVVIRTIEKSLDAEDEVVSSKAGRKFIYMDREDNLETPNDETCTDFTDFMVKLGLNKAVVKQAIREMEAE